MIEKGEGFCRKGHDRSVVGVYRYERNGRANRMCAECARERSKRSHNARKRRVSHVQYGEGHCVHGHDLAVVGVYLTRSGGAKCRECGRIRAREQYREARRRKIAEQKATRSRLSADQRARQRQSMRRLYDVDPTEQVLEILVAAESAPRRERDAMREQAARIWRESQ